MKRNGITDATALLDGDPRELAIAALVSDQEVQGEICSALIQSSILEASETIEPPVEGPRATAREMGKGDPGIETELKLVLERCAVAEDRVRLLEQEREAYQQEMFESERQSAWLAKERQSLLDRFAGLEAYCGEGDPTAGLQPQIDKLAGDVALQKAYIADLESWVSRAEERAAQAEAEAVRLRALTAGNVRPPNMN